MLFYTNLKLILALSILASCTRSNILQPEVGSNSKKDSDETSVDPQNPQIRPGDEVVVQPSPQPDHSPGPDVDPTPTSAPIQSSGNLKFKAVLFINMEHQAHATDYDTYAVLKNSSGTLVAAGPVTVKAATSGKSLGGMGYPVTELNVSLEKISSDTRSSGEGKLSVCRVKEKTTYECADDAKAIDQERPVAWLGKSVQYSVSGDQVTVNSEAGMIGNGPGVAGGLSFAPPIAMAAMGGDVNIYVDAASPIVLDLNGNGKLDLISLTEKTNKARFDLTGHGSLKKLGWVSQEDGLLALDVNKDGVINSGVELFGEYSKELKPSQEIKPVNFENGFLALAQYDDNKDLKIDASDSVYGSLKVWIDKNGNGKSEVKELKSLKEMDIVSLSLVSTSTYTGETYMKEAGNELRYLGSYKTGKGQTRLSADVWFMQEMVGMARAH